MSTYEGLVAKWCRGKSAPPILVQKYYVVGIKTVVVAIKCIKRRVFFLGAVRKIVSTTFIYVRIVKITHGFHSYSLLVVF